MALVAVCGFRRSLGTGKSLSFVRDHMRRAFLIASLLLAGYSSAAASAESLPSELYGYWVPSRAACSSSLGIRVSAQTIQFRKGDKQLSFQIEPCFSCEGGARYSGIVVWAIPKNSKDQSFTAYFNAGERKGVTVVEIPSSELQSQFPLNNVKLKNCGP